MATKQQPQPSTVAQPEMPAQPVGYQAYPQQYTYADPNKGKAKLLTLEYALAMSSAVISAFLLINVISSVFGLWADTTSVLVKTVGGFFAPLMETPGTGIVAGAVFALLLAVLSFILFSRVSKAVPDREGYTQRAAYKLVTYGGVAALAIPAIELVARLVSILINSLLFIGITGAEKIYKSLYLSEFLPYLLAFAVVAVSIYFIYQIVQGRNTSKALTLTLVAASSIVLLASAITIAVKVHNASSSVPSTTTTDYKYNSNSQYKSYRSYSTQ